MNTNTPTNNTWITIVLITAIIMLIFLVFYGNKNTTPMPTPERIPTETTTQPEEKL